MESVIFVDNHWHKRTVMYGPVSQAMRHISDLFQLPFPDMLLLVRTFENTFTPVLVSKRPFFQLYYFTKVGLSRISLDFGKITPYPIHINFQ